MGAKGPTLHEVAERAGVSTATVSRVVRGIQPLSAATIDKVNGAIRELRYRPNHFGQALANRRHEALGIVFPGLRGPYYSEVIHGFELEAVKHHKSLLILGTELLDSAIDQVMGMADRADGLAILGGTVDDFVIQDLVKRGVPVVTMARTPLQTIPNLDVDNTCSTVALVRHLIRDHGYTRLGFVGDMRDDSDSAVRWRAFLQAHHEAGIPAPGKPLFNGMEHDAGVQAALQIFASPDRPQALVCANDELALGVLNIARARGIDVPGDMALTGWDDIPFASLSIPTLTTVRQPARELGSRTASILLSVIDGSLPQPLHETLPTDLIVRASCGCDWQPDSVLDLPEIRQSAARKEAAAI